MKPHEQQAFILENPTHFLNPHRAEYMRAQRGMSRGTDMFGQPLPWWSRWGQGSGMSNPYGGGTYGVGAGYGGYMQGSTGMMAGYGQARNVMGGVDTAYGAGSGFGTGVGSAGTQGQGQSGWKRLFSRGGGGMGTQQAYLQQQQQYLQASRQPHGQGFGAYEPDQGKEAGFGYAQVPPGHGEFGQQQYLAQGQGQGHGDARQVYQVPVESRMVYPTGQRWQ